MLLAIRCPDQFWILLVLVNFRSVEICEPSLDIPAWHDDYCRVLRSSRWNPFLSALIIELRVTLFRSEVVRINNNNKLSSLLGSYCPQFMRIPFPYPLFSGLRPMRKRRRFNISVPPFAFFQEPPDERIGLTVLAKQDNANPLHSCQSLATTSERVSPSIILGGTSLTRTGPIPSRENQRPLEPPR